MKNKSIVIINGDPESTFNEILIKTLKNKFLKNIGFSIIMVCSEKLFKDELKRLNTKIKFQKFESHNNLNKNNIYIIDVPLNYKNLSVKNKNFYIKKSFDVGLNLLKKNSSLALINGPISKKTFLKNKFNGITEYLAYKTKTKDFAMIIYNKKLSVSPITTHIPIKYVAKKIKKNKIINKIKLISNFWNIKFKKKAKVGITGLNPHCESIAKYNEDKTIIFPAIKLLKKRGIKIDGPFPADTIFLSRNRKKFNIIVGMYHDQVLTPIKTIYEYEAINITVGLPFLRISPDHGPNEKMLGKNKSNPMSLIKAIQFLDKN